MLLVLFLIGAVAAFAALMANVTAWAWNMVVFTLLHGPGPIDGWTGLAINFLASIVFGRGYASDRIDRG